MPLRRPYKPSTLGLGRGSGMERGSSSSSSSSISSKGILGRHKHALSLFFLLLVGALLFLALLFHAQHQQPPDPIPLQQLQQQPPPLQVVKEEKEASEVAKGATQASNTQAATVRRAQEKGGMKKWVSELVVITTCVQHACASLPTLVRPTYTDPLPSPHPTNTGLPPHHHPRHLLPRPQNWGRVRQESP